MGREERKERGKREGRRERERQSDRDPRAVQCQKRKDKEEEGRKGELFRFTDRPTEAHLPRNSNEL